MRDKRSYIAVTCALCLFCLNATGDTITDYSFAKRPVTDLFVHNEHVWIVQLEKVGSLLLHSADRGSTWEETRLPYSVHRLFFLDAMNGWAIASLSLPDKRNTHRLLQTEDGGHNWIDRVNLISDSTDTSTFIADFVFLTTTDGLFFVKKSGSNSTLLYTDDGGRSVVERAVPDGVVGTAIASRADVWVYGYTGIFHSGDLGKTWAIQFAPNDLSRDIGKVAIFVLRATNDGTAIAIGHGVDGVVLETNDRGQHWRLAAKINSARVFSNIAVRNQTDEICLVSSFLICSPDRFASTSEIGLPKPKKNQSPLFHEVVFMSPSRGWALRAGGYFYETTDRAKHWKELDVRDLSKRRDLQSRVKVEQTQMSLKNSIKR